MTWHTHARLACNPGLGNFGVHPIVCVCGDCDSIVRPVTDRDLVLRADGFDLLDEMGCFIVPLRTPTEVRVVRLMACVVPVVSCSTPQPVIVVLALAVHGLLGNQPIQIICYRFVCCRYCLLVMARHLRATGRKRQKQTGTRRPSLICRPPNVKMCAQQCVHNQG